MPLVILYMLITFKFRNLNIYFHDLGYVIDVFGNVALQYALNFFLLTEKSKNRFGYKSDTISRVLGANIYYSEEKKYKILWFNLHRFSELSLMGDILVLILSKKHCVDAFRN